MLGRSETVANLCRRFPTSGLLQSRASAGGLTALGFAIMMGPDKLNTVKALVEAGADPTVRTADTGATVLHNLAANPDAGEELARYVLGVKGVRDELIDRPMRPRTLKWKFQLLFCGLMAKLGSRKAVFNALSEWPGQTPVAGATRNGNLAVVEVLVKEGGANTSLRNRRGHNALDQVHVVSGGAGLGASGTFMVKNGSRTDSLMKLLSHSANRNSAISL